MAHPEYSHIGTPEAIAMEECSELIQALCKVDRFGWYSCHPETGKQNLSQVLDEINDVESALCSLKNYILNNV